VTRQVLAKVIANVGPVSDSAAKLAADFIDGLSRKHRVSAEQFPLVRSLLTDTRFSVPRGAWGAVRYASDAGDDYFEAIAASMFLRLASIADTDDGPYPAWRDCRRSPGSCASFRPGRFSIADLDWFAAERLRVWPIRRSCVEPFGADAPTLLWLMDEAVRLKDRTGSDWNNTYVAGLTGLCRMGAAGRAMIEPMYERLNAGVMVKYGSYWDLTIQTLVGMGADPDEMWGHLQTDDRNHTQQRFAREVTRAQKKRACVY
jgi:hypothetical protein